MQKARDHWHLLTENTKGVAFGLMSALMLTAYLVTNKYVYNTYHPSAVEYSLLFALAGGAFGLASLVHRFDRAAYRKAWHDKRAFATLTVASFVAVGLLVIGQRYTTSVNAAIVSSCTILTTMFFSVIMLGESPSRRQLLWLLPLFVGLYIGIVGFHGFHINKGDAIILISEVIFGFGNVLSRRTMRKHGSFFVPNIRLVLAALLAAFFSIFFMRHWQLIITILPWTMVAGMFYWLTMKTFAKSVHLVNANHAIVLNNGQIIFTALAGVLLLGEHYSWEKLLGSIIVLVSIYYITWKGRE